MGERCIIILVIKEEYHLETWQKLGIACLIYVFSGVFGWIYEFIFYYFNGGMKDFYLQGGNFLPWINIYAFGAFLIIFLVWKLKLKQKPLLVFLVSLLATGILEYISGWLIFEFGNGTRYWNYNVEIWNFGNLDGFVCLRSVLVFGLSALFLIYLLLPFLIKLSKVINKKLFLILAFSLFGLFFIDEIYNLIIVRLFDTPSAVDIYKSLGFKYVE